MTSPRCEVDALGIIACLSKESTPMIVGSIPVSAPRGEPASDVGQGCDGLHDESAPVQYLCLRCFPDRGDLTEPQDDEYDEARRDEDEEME